MQIMVFGILATAHLEPFYPQRDCIKLEPEGVCGFMSTKGSQDTSEMVGTLGDERDMDSGNTIFLTGGTGFLGSFLLLELLKRLDKGKKMIPHNVFGEDMVSKPLKKVVCLVRGSSPEACKIRLWKSLQNWFGNSSKNSPEDITPSLVECFNSNVFAVPGDITLPKLGLSSEDWNTIVHEVNHVIHNGASIHLLASFKQLEAANVNSVREVIQMAREAKTLFLEKDIIVHFVSSMGVGIKCYTNSGGVGKWVAPESVHSFPSVYSRVDGYALTKYVAEKLLMEATQFGEFSAKIYRAGIIIGSSVSGKGAARNVFSSLVRSAALLGKVPYLPGPSYLVPVNVVANSIISIALDSPSKSVLENNWVRGGEDKVEKRKTPSESRTEDKIKASLKVFHLVPSESLSWASVLQVIKKSGPETEVLASIEDWKTELEKRVKIQEKLAQFFPMVLVLKGFFSQPGPTFSSFQTDEALKNIGLPLISNPTESAIMKCVNEIQNNTVGKAKRAFHVDLVANVQLSKL